MISNNSNIIIKDLIRNASGINSDLDETLISLSSVIVGAESNERLEEIKRLRRTIKALETEHIKALSCALSMNTKQSSIDAIKAGYAEAISDNPNAIGFYAAPLYKSVIANLASPALKVAACSELIKLSRRYHPTFTYPKYWDEVVSTHGIVDLDKFNEASPELDTDNPDNMDNEDS